MMAMAFQGGPLDGRVEALTEEELTAEWVDGLKAYAVSDEEGNSRGLIGSPAFGTPMEEPKKPWRTQGFLSMAIFLVSMLVWSAGVLIADLALKTSLFSLAYAALVAAYLLKKWD